MDWAIIKKLLVGVGVLFLLSGCIAEQKRSLAECELQASKEQGFPVGNVLLDESINLCMRAQGYEFDKRNRGCQITMTTGYGAHCWVPNTKVGRILYWLEHRVENALGAN
jgi:hypothetical protein